MMAEGQDPGGPIKSRAVLGDLTNLIGKRGLLVREKNEMKGSDFNDKEGVKRIRISPPPCTEIHSLKGNVISGISKISDDIMDPDVSCFGSNFSVSKNSIDADNVGVGNSKVHEGNEVLDPKGEDICSQSGLIDGSKDEALLWMDKISIATEVDGHGKLEDASKEKTSLGNVKDKCISHEHSTTKSAYRFETTGCGELMPGSSRNINPKMFDLGNDNATTIKAHGEPSGSFPADTSRTVSESGNDCRKCDAGEENIGSQSDIRYDTHNYVDDYDADNFFSSQSGSIDCTMQSESLKEDECAYMSGNTCSCSFCTKAAYMWLDLNYQDMKARLSVMKKSQKDATILAEQSSRIKFNEKKSTENFTRESKLESHLMYQWRSLFQRTSGIWGKEGNQLEASLLPLTELREKCKTDLESINAKMTEKR